MTTAIIGTGGIGSVIARQLASGGETLRLSSADKESARRLAAQIGAAAVVAAGNREALQGACPGHLFGRAFAQTALTALTSGRIAAAAILGRASRRGLPSCYASIRTQVRSI
jgi:saccharopine dehydrogenase-like NADP-dependent oxidoreductase